VCKAGCQGRTVYLERGMYVQYPYLFISNYKSRRPTKDRRGGEATSAGAVEGAPGAALGAILRCAPRLRVLGCLVGAPAAASPHRLPAVAIPVACMCARTCVLVCACLEVWHGRVLVLTWHD
jgi:hypothetical protein